MASVSPADVLRAEQEIREANLTGIQLLKQQPDAAFAYFDRAHRLANDASSFLAADPAAQRRALAATENNLGLFYHQVGQHRAAVTHLAAARDLERSMGRDALSPAVTLLNLAQILMK